MNNDHFLTIKILKNMRISFLIKSGLCFILLGNAMVISNAGAQPSLQPNRPKSKWVYINPQGKLVYKATEKGDRIMDFSFAGYMGGSSSRIHNFNSKIIHS